MDEAEAVKQRYARRERRSWSAYYDPMKPAVFMAEQERERAFIRAIVWSGMLPVRDKQVLEVGCGGGRNLLQLIRLGFRPENLVGNDLLEERVHHARNQLPAATQVLEGDASTLDVPRASFDIVLQSLVFANLLDDDYQQKLATHMWDLTRPGGAVLWYDFIYNNPRNPDVRGIPLRRVRQLFPYGTMKAWRVTLAPPISRGVTRVHPSLYTIFNMVPLLRTHVVCCIRKEQAGSGDAGRERA